jgi:hypothetical protein
MTNPFLESSIGDAAEYTSGQRRAPDEPRQKQKRPASCETGRFEIVLMAAEANYVPSFHDAR